MIRLNIFQYNPQDIKTCEFENYSLDSLVTNFEFEKLLLNYKEEFGYAKIRTFSFSKEGFLGLFLELKGKIAISLGETHALIEAGILYESLGFEIIWLELNKDGSVDLQKLQNLQKPENQDIKYLFLSSYVIDTFLETSIENVKKITNAKIISNASADISDLSDVVYFDNYKLSGYSLSGVMLLNEDIFELLYIGFTDTLAIKICFESIKNLQNNATTIKSKFIKTLKDKFKDDMYFFVDNNSTLENSFHIGLKEIKARELIRTLSFEKIFLSNGEGCSLGLSKPSRVIQAMGYDETTSRNALSFSFNKNFSDETINKIVDTMYKKYIQIKSLN